MVHNKTKRRDSLPTWIEANVHLPAGVAADPGPIKLYPYQRGIAQAIGDPKVELVTVIRARRSASRTLTGSPPSDKVLRRVG